MVENTTEPFEVFPTSTMKLITSILIVAGLALASAISAKTGFVHDEHHQIFRRMLQDLGMAGAEDQRKSSSVQHSCRVFTGSAIF